MTTKTTTLTTEHSTIMPIDCNQACIGKHLQDKVALGCCLPFYCYCDGDGIGHPACCGKTGEVCDGGNTGACGDNLDMGTEPICEYECTADKCCKGTSPAPGTPTTWSTLAKFPDPLAFGISCPFGPMPDQKTMRRRCLGGFSVMWATKLFISPVKKGFFAQIF